MQTGPQRLAVLAPDMCLLGPNQPELLHSELLRSARRSPLAQKKPEPPRLLQRKSALLLPS